MAGSVIIAGARTPIGKLSGALAGFSAAELGGFAIKAALERAGLSPDQVDYVLMGHVLQAGGGQITARVVDRGQAVSHELFRDVRETQPGPLLRLCRREGRPPRWQNVRRASSPQLKRQLEFEAQFLCRWQT